MPLKKVALAAFAALLVLPGVSDSAYARGQHAGASAKQYKVVDRIPAADGGWDFAAVDPQLGKLYIARSDAVTSVDLKTRQVVSHLASAHRGHQVLVLDKGATLFETDGETGLGRFLSASDGSVLAEVATGKKPDAALVDPKTGLIVVMNAGDGTIALIDPVSRKLADKITIGGGLEFAVADGKGSIFVNIEDANSVVKVDLAARKQTATIALTGCDGPTGLALVANGTRLISACANETAVVVDTVHKAVIGHFVIGKDPDAVLADETRGLAFIPCGGSGTLVAVAIGDPARIRPIVTIDTQKGAKTGAIDPRDGRIYLPTATLAAPEPGAKRGKPVPGSFVILVVAPQA
jgi:hypothetical protein